MGLFVGIWNEMDCMLIPRNSMGLSEKEAEFGFTRELIF
jgi:hypothetical protein